MDLEYPDLPAWAQPGQKAVRMRYGDATEVTIARVTRTQIIACDRHDQEFRFDRTPLAPNKYGSAYQQWADFGFKERGEWGAYLVTPDEPRAHASFLRVGLLRAVRKAREARRKGSVKPPAKLGELEQWAVEQLDELENAVRAARAEVEKLTKRHRERAALLHEH
jgi:hypothetical protein